MPLDKRRATVISKIKLLSNNIPEVTYAYGLFHVVSTHLLSYTWRGGCKGKITSVLDSEGLRLVREVDGDSAVTFRDLSCLRLPLLSGLTCARSDQKLAEPPSPQHLGYTRAQAGATVGHTSSHHHLLRWVTSPLAVPVGGQCQHDSSKVRYRDACHTHGELCTRVSGLKAARRHCLDVELAARTAPRGRNEKGRRTQSLIIKTKGQKNWA